ncbi:MAG: YdbH domain-containing protein [Candidatus Omnitrophica bacterium]|nr:YdbH domain-containing protein [Candidatus Omnitrophota bacterium]MCM8827139.1 YdbH domain-containing protein [Candidatus Omnitrophota bacterium]
MRKRNLLFIFIIFLLVFLALLFIEPLIIHLAKTRIEKILPNCSVKIGDCKFELFDRLNFSSIEISKLPHYELRIDNLNIFYNLDSIVNKKLLKVSLHGGYININLPQRNLLFIPNVTSTSPKKSFLFLDFLELTNIEINLDFSDCKINGKISTILSLKDINRLFKFLDLNIDYGEIGNFKIEYGNININEDSSGLFKLNKLKYNDLLLRNIYGNIRLGYREVYLPYFSGELFGGHLSGNLGFLYKNNPIYSFEFKFFNIDTSRVVKAFKFMDKVWIKGRVDGELVFKIEDNNLNVINGYFSAIEPGGNLTIKDKRLLEKLPGVSSKQLDLLVESFKDYSYNRGVVKLGLQGNDLLVEINLDGDKGKRNLNINFYDFNRAILSFKDLITQGGKR